MTVVIILLVALVCTVTGWFLGAVLLDLFDDDDDDWNRFIATAYASKKTPQPRELRAAEERAIEHRERMEEWQRQYNYIVWGTSNLEKAASLERCERERKLSAAMASIESSRAERERAYSEVRVDQLLDTVNVYDYDE